METDHYETSSHEETIRKQHTRDIYKRILNFEHTLRSAGVSEGTILLCIMEMCSHQIERLS